jgi:hypothetical protein
MASKALQECLIQGEKNKEVVLSGVKTDTTMTYSGTPNMDVLETFTYKFDLWVEMSGLTRKWAVKLMVYFLEGKAHQFYMKHIPTSHAKWSLKEVMMACLTTASQMIINYF